MHYLARHLGRDVKRLVISVNLGRQVEERYVRLRAFDDYCSSAMPFLLFRGWSVGSERIPGRLELSM